MRDVAAIPANSDDPCSATGFARGRRRPPATGQAPPAGPVPVCSSVASSSLKNPPRALPAAAGRLRGVDDRPVRWTRPDRAKIDPEVYEELFSKTHLWHGFRAVAGIARDESAIPANSDDPCSATGFARDATAPQSGLGYRLDVLNRGSGLAPTMRNATVTMLSSVTEGRRWADLGEPLRRRTSTPRLTGATRGAAPHPEPAKFRRPENATRLQTYNRGHAN